MLNEIDQRKIREFVSATNWACPDWADEEQVSQLLDILKAFNNDPQTAIEYWKKADQKSMAAIKQNYLDRLSRLGFSMENKISTQELLNYFNGDQQAVDHFKADLKKEGQKISKQVFYNNFTVVVTQMLAKQHTVQ